MKIIWLPGDGPACKYFCVVFQDTGVLELVNDGVNHPVTVFMPSDATMASLPQEQKDFLFHQQNRKQLLEYLKFHILPNQKVNLPFQPI